MRHLRSLLLASALALPLAGQAALADTPAGVLVVAQNIDDIVAIDPAQAYEFTSGELVTNIYESPKPVIERLKTGLSGK